MVRQGKNGVRMGPSLASALARFGRRPRRNAGPPARRVPRTKLRRGVTKRPSRLTHHIWHPLMSSQSWVPDILRMTPSVRVRDYSVHTTGLITGTTNPIAIILQPTLDKTDARTLQCGIIGKFGAGATVVTAGSAIPTKNGAFFGKGRMRLHRLGVTLTCNGPTLAGALLPVSYARIGVLRTLLDPNNYTNFGGIALTLEANPAMHTFGALQLMNKPAHAASHPVDVMDWASYKEGGNAAALDYEPDDTLAPICIYLSVGTTLDQYTLTVHADWDYLPHDDSSGSDLMASTAVHHPSIPMNVIQETIGKVQQVSGVFEASAESVAATIGSVGNGVRSLGEALNAFSAFPRPARQIAARMMPALMG